MRIKRLSAILVCCIGFQTFTAIPVQAQNEHPASLENVAKLVKTTGRSVHFQSSKRLGLDDYTTDNPYYEISSPGPHGLTFRNILVRLVNNPLRYDIVLTRLSGITMYSYVTSEKVQFLRGTRLQRGKRPYWLKHSEAKEGYLKEVNFWLDWEEKKRAELGLPNK